jgi:hypothetical protein
MRGIVHTSVDRLSSGNPHYAAVCSQPLF